MPVFTTLNQCLLCSDVSVSVDDNSFILSHGEKEYDQVDWVFHDGVGYVFPEPTKVSIKNEETSGSWWRINKQTDSPKKEISLGVFSLWLDHDVRPSDESYAYIVVPAVSTEELSTKRSKNNIHIISNSPELQAVHHKGLDMYQVVFYKNGTIQLTDEITLTSDSPGIVLLKMKDERAKQISVSDPNRELGKMNLSITAEVTGQGDTFTIYQDKNKEISRVSIDLPQGVYAGKSVTIDF